MPSQLELKKCPHCGIDSPNLELKTSFNTSTYDNEIERMWGIYICKRCGSVVTASAQVFDKHYSHERLGNINKVFPSITTVKDSVPARAKKALQDAIDCLHSPSPAIMSAARSIDLMLKEKGLKDGSLFNRIDQAAKDHLITNEMALWAHEVRLEANDERHGNEEAKDATDEEARRIIDFAKALAEFLFVLPSKVQRGREEAKPTTTKGK